MTPEYEALDIRTRSAIDAKPDDSAFVLKSKFFKRLARGGRWFKRVGPKPYVRERAEGEIEGKQNIKAAKRARVRAMKAAQEAK